MKTNISNTASLLLCICSLVVSSCCREEQPCVSLISPANGATNVAPGNQTLTWSTSCPAADSFEVVLSPSSTFAASTTNGAPIYSQTYRVRGTSCTVVVQMNGIYYWRVRPLNAGVNQAWSPTFRFDAVDILTPKLGLYTNMSMERWFVVGRTHYRDFTWDSIGSVTITRSENFVDGVVANVNGYSRTMQYFPNANRTEYYDVAPPPFYFYVNLAYGRNQDSVELAAPRFTNDSYYFIIRGKK